MVREHDYTQQDSTTYLVGTNINRQSYKYTSKTTEEYQKLKKNGWKKKKSQIKRPKKISQTMWNNFKKVKDLAIGMMVKSFFILV